MSFRRKEKMKFWNANNLNFSFFLSTFVPARTRIYVAAFIWSGSEAVPTGGVRCSCHWHLFHAETWFRFQAIKYYYLHGESIVSVSGKKRGLAAKADSHMEDNLQLVPRWLLVLVLSMLSPHYLPGSSVRSNHRLEVGTQILLRLTLFYLEDMPALIGKLVVPPYNNRCLRRVKVNVYLRRCTTK